ncbi:MAG: hypothetical protein AB8C84_06255 [Oligoflexales bacterium]
MPSNHKSAGIHIAGANSSKTSIVIMQMTSTQKYKITDIHQHLGPRSYLSSDDRIEHILQHPTVIKDVVIDAPLSLPPCVRCVRSICPGFIHCDDTAIACLLKIDKERKRKTLCNPQTHRLWDIYKPDIITDHSSRSSLVTRSLTLQKRLRVSNIELKETSVPDTLKILDPHTPYNSYKHFEKGSFFRKKYLDKLQKWIIYSNNDREKLNDLEVFQAFICSWIAAMSFHKSTQEKPIFFPKEESFPQLPLTHLNSL